MAVGGDDDTIAGTLPAVAGSSVEVPELVAGRYRIVRWLGGGGMGRVYEALDTELGERVALKMLRGGLSDDAVERFRREVKLTRRIVHANVARMFDIGEHAGDRFLTMELVAGTPLTAELGRPLPWARLQRLAVQICDGLAAAHRAGVIHRDLKPDNVLVERGTDRVVLTDFGIARSGDDVGVTQIGTLIGTPRYMAPEQLAGQEVDARADLFALGVILYEMTTGSRPWPGDNAIAIAVAQATQPARPIGDVRVPGQLLAVIERCLALERDQRPGSADEVRDALAGIAALPERPTPSPTRPPIAPPPPLTEDSSIAVLPFACAAADAYLADGITEELVDTLSAAPTLRVRPTGLLRSAEAIDPRVVGRDLAVDHVVMGALRRTPAGLRVSARLISVADGFQIWAQRIDGTEADVLTASDQLAAGIAQALSTRASAVTRPMDPRAVDLYLRARAELRRFWGENALRAADLLAQAVEIAPTSVPVISALAVARVQSWIRVGSHAQRALAFAAVERALATGHGEALFAQGTLDLNTGDHEAAARHFAQALARAPMSAGVHEACGRLLIELGPIDEGRRHLETAIGLDPGRLNIIQGDLARVDALDGDLAGSLARLEAVQRDADRAVAQFGAMFAARMAAWARDLARLESLAPRLEARMSTSTMPGKFGRSTEDMVRAYFAWKTGRPFDRAGFESMLVFDPAEPHRGQIVMFQRIAEIAMVIDQRESAHRALRLAADAGLIDIVYLDGCPLYRELTADAAWRETRAIVADAAARTLAAYHAAR